MIISHGFMVKHWERIRLCLQHQDTCSDAGCLLAACMWEAGLAVTDPGPALMSADRSYVMFGNPEAQELMLQAPLLTDGDGDGCDEHCSWLLTHAVSVEVRGPVAAALTARLALVAVPWLLCPGCCLGSVLSVWTGCELDPTLVSIWYTQAKVLGSQENVLTPWPLPAGACRPLARCEGPDSGHEPHAVWLREGPGGGAEADGARAAEAAGHSWAWQRSSRQAFCCCWWCWW